MALIDRLVAIADAVRGKTGKADPLTLEQMATEIEGIEAGGGNPMAGYFDFVISSNNIAIGGILEEKLAE